MKTWTAALALMSCLAATGCGGGVFNAPGSSSSSSSSSEEDGGRVVGAGDGEDQSRASSRPPGKRKTRYDFTLPVGETAVDESEGKVYEALSMGRCDEAQALLDGSRQGFRSELTVPLFQAGVHLCRGDVAAARAAYARAVYTNEEGVWFICALDRAVGSVVRGRPKSALGACPPVVPRSSTPEPESSPEASPESSPEASPESSPEASAESSPESSTESSTGSSPDAGSSPGTESTTGSEPSGSSEPTSGTGAGQDSEPTSGSGSGPVSEPAPGAGAD
ncbi:hypothetical protein [Nonomuraea rubra]|uniref:Tetratricopeptide repeat protein n=1 Tax=Nonomuraea rubra TaxID=46180 RepID=A0A7X0P235_9ACTN|nr:hypothetical protein [Nonomuraea rubra]MBB6553871.1 hypothetical protein [Nonomuraea rubra]